MAKRKRRAFTKEFKAQAVRIVRESGKAISAVARELDLTETALRSWVRQAEIDAGRGTPGALTTEEREELGRLRRENRTLRMERDILKKRRPSSRRRTREIPVHRRGEGRLPGAGALPHAPGVARGLLRLAGAAAGAARAGGRTAGSRDRGDPRGDSATLREPPDSRGARGARVPDGSQARGAAHAGSRAGRAAPPPVSGHDAVAASVSHRPQRSGAAIRTDWTGPGVGHRHHLVQVTNLIRGRAGPLNGVNV